MRLRFLFLFILCLALPWNAIANGPADGKEQPIKPAIVLASFGSTDKAAQATQARFVAAVKKKYPDVPVLTGLTARMVMSKLREQGKDSGSLYRAMADAADAGYTHVAVQSLQVIPGQEFEGVRQIAMAQASLAKGIREVAVGAPLIASNEDAALVAKGLLEALPTERKKDEPVIFVGHGTHHGLGGLIYPALAWHLRELDSQAYASTIEGTPDMEGTLESLGKAKKGQRVWLVPLLALAGEHAANDLFGDEEDSWMNSLKAAGWECKPVRTAMMDVPALRDVWLAHLHQALAELGYGK